MDKIETMRAFAAVARDGSFTVAARRLGMSTKLASKYVRQLETRLQTQLLSRTTRSVSLTDVGAAYLERCRPILEQVDELESLVKERQTSLAGPVRITAPTAFGSAKLTQALLPFMLAHRQVEIDLKLSDNRIALVEEGFDLAIRIGTLRDSTLIVRKLADMPMIVCAAPEYLNKHGRPSNPKALATHDCLIDENQPDATAWRFHSAHGDVAVKVGGTLRANSPGAIAQMAIGGLGIARSPRYVVEAALENGKLEPLLRAFTTLEFGLFAVYPPNRHLTARVRALIDHLAQYLGPQKIAPA